MTNPYYRRLLTIGWIFWATIVLIVYYEQVGKLVQTNPSKYVAQFPSLAFFPLVWNTFTFDLWSLSVSATFHAFFRMIQNLFGAGTVLLTATVLGNWIFKLLKTDFEEWQERVLYQITVGLGSLSYILLGLSYLGLYTPFHIYLLIGLLISIEGLRLIFKNRFSPPFLQKSSLNIPCQWWRCSCHREQIWVGISAIGLSIAAIHALSPEREYDALWYHLGLPKLWLASGYLINSPTEYVSLYPMTWELLFGAALALSGPIGAKLLHFACLPLAALLTYQFTRKFAPRASPWLAVAFFTTIPIVLWEATTAYVDLALTIYVGLTIYALVRYLETHHRQWLILGICNLGFGLGTKHLALISLAICSCGLLVILWQRKSSLWQALIPCFLLIILSLSMGLPWYSRSWWETGNPVFPQLYWLFGTPPEWWDGTTQEGLDRFLSGFGRPRTFLNQLTLPWDFTIHAARYGGTLGPLFLILIPILPLVRHKRFPVVLFLMAFVILYITFWASPISSFQMRFLLPITPLLCVLGAESCHRLQILFRSTKNIFIQGIPIYGFLAFLLILNLPPFISFHEKDRNGWDGWLTHVIRDFPLRVVIGVETETQYLTRSVPSFRVWQYVNSNLQDHEKVLTFSGGDNLYSNVDRIWSYATLVRPAVWAEGTAKKTKILQALKTLGISHVLFDQKTLKSLDSTPTIAEPSLLAQWFDLEYQDSRFFLYRLRQKKQLSYFQLPLLQMRNPTIG